MQTITNVQNATTQQIVLPAADAVKPENDATNENSTETSATSTSTITPSPSLTKITSSDTLTGLPLVSPTSTPSITPSPSIEGVNLLSPALPEQQKEERREKIYKFILSFAYCFSFLAYANAAAALNWSTEQLKNLTKVGDEEIGWVFFIKGFGYLIGTGISGKIYGLLSIKKGQEVKWYRFTPHSLYTLMQLSLATFIAVVPLPSAYWALMILYLFVGISQGFMETGGCSFLVWLWKKQADPWLSFIQFFYGVGSVLSPLIANQILTENPESFLEMRIVHWIIAGLCVLSVIPFPFLKVPEVYDTKLPPTTENGNQASKKKREFLPGKTFWITLGCGLVIGFSTGALISYTGLIFTYCRKKQMSVKGSTFLASAAWMAITFGRLVMTPVMAFIDSRVIIIVSLTGCFIGLGIMLIVGNLVSAWVGTIIFGLFLSPQYPAVVGYPSSVGVNITSTMTGIIICCSAAGSMILPYLVNFLFPLLGPESLIYLVLASLFCGAVIFVIMLFAFRRKANPGDPPQKWYHFFLKNKNVNEEKKVEKPEFVALQQIAQTAKTVAQV